jgi:hypothetical protein
MTESRPYSGVRQVRWLGMTGFCDEQRGKIVLFEASLSLVKRRGVAQEPRVNSGCRWVDRSIAL